MKKEKHKWVKVKRCFLSLEDKDHHFVSEFYECSECGAIKEVEDKK